MEVNSNLTKLYGVFGYLAEVVGDLSKIKYKAGNEEKISQIIENVKDYLILKDLLINNKPNIRCNKELENILALLIVNTEFKSIDGLSTIKQFSHFIKAIPLISKCVLVNITVVLGLVEQCCSLMLTLPYNVGTEIFDEFITCSKQCDPSKLLNDSYSILDTIIKMLINLDAQKDQQNRDTADKLGDIASEMLKNVSCINEDWAQKMKARQIHEHMSYTLLYFFKLLRLCPLHNSTLSRVIQTLVDVSITIIMSVTINVFCTWAEVKYENDQPMQIVIAGEAYMVMEYLEKYKPAKQLVEMLGPMARKPKTINEIILEADVETIIAKIDKADENQRLWLRGLINTSVFTNEKAMNCLDKWVHLCTKDDVMRLLGLSVHHNELQVKELVLKCAKVLNVQELQFVSTRYFCEYNTNNLDTGSVKSDLRTLINRTQSGSEVDDDFIKNLYLLLLQNPEVLMSSLYLECLKTDAYASYFKRAFSSIKIAVEVIPGLAKNTFINIFKENRPTTKSLVCHKNLLDMLLELNYFNTHTILNEVFKPQLEEFLSDDNYEILCILQLLNIISIEYVLHENTLEVIAVLSKILEKARCKFINFLVIKQNIVQEVVDVLMKYSSSSNALQHNMKYKDFLDKLEIQNLLNRYYITRLYQKLDKHFLDYVHPQTRFNGTMEDRDTLTKILPSCVSSEWILVVKELDCCYNNYDLLLSRFEEILTLIGEAILKSPENSNMQESLKYYLQQYGIAIKEVLKPKYNTLTQEISLIKSMCYILKEMPDNVKKTEGLQLISLLSADALRSLKDNENFILSLVSIKDTKICQILAQKMLSTD